MANFLPPAGENLSGFAPGLTQHLAGVLLPVTALASTLEPVHLPSLPRSEQCAPHIYSTPTNILPPKATFDPASKTMFRIVHIHSIRAKSSVNPHLDIPHAMQMFAHLITDGNIMKQSETMTPEASGNS
ncbi:hypothetical protein B0H13DRAFT_2673150 [Mycena leptocephala]|nr:hypothetical protein B0H13DRAFT_2673150 [Mycena leptocephala]